MFVVQDLNFATLATVSRCGMVWFSEDVLSLDMIFEHYLSKLKSLPIDEGEEEVRGGGGSSDQETLSPVMQVGLILEFCVYMYLQWEILILYFHAFL